MPKLKIGMIGAGQISRSAGTSIRKHADAQIVAAFDPQREAPRRAPQGARDRPRPQHARRLPRRRRDRGRLRRRAEQVPRPDRRQGARERPALHVGQAPSPSTNAEAKGVVDKANEVGKTFMLGMNQRFPAGRQRVRKLVRGRRAGRGLPRQGLLAPPRRHPDAQPPGSATRRSAAAGACSTSASTCSTRRCGWPTTSSPSASWARPTASSATAASARAGGACPTPTRR